nr:hypothetical protein [uncultured Peptostreptococcus sp.]
MLSREKFEEFFPELPVRIVFGLDRKEGKIILSISKLEINASCIM